MRLFNKAAIVGTGLIGGSLALALRRKKLAQVIIGVSRHKETLVLAKNKRIIDIGSQDLNIIRDVDLVVLATPVGSIINLATAVSEIIRQDCIVTDVGSTKREIVFKLEGFFPRFVGSHPLAGSEKRGIINASAQIFENSLCILTPTRNTDSGALKKIKDMWLRLGSKVISLSASRHDEVLSFVSYLPHAVAFSLINSIPEKYLKFAAGGLKDTTRIAASDSKLWVDIFLSSRSDIIKAISLFKDNLSRLEAVVRKNDVEALSKILAKAKRKREALK